MARGKAHSPETRAAVMAALLAGQSISETARQYALDVSIVSRWAKSVATELQVVALEKGNRIEELTFSYLEELLVCLRNQAKVVGTVEYISKQPASEIAVLHGVMADKGFRLLAAIPAALIQPDAEEPLRISA